MEKTINVSDGPAVAKRALFLAWKASRVLGAGVLQDRGPGMTEDQVWANAGGQADYPARPAHAMPKPDEVSADYVFGRMMKLHMRFTPESVIVWEQELRADYQSWCLKYKSYEALIGAAEAELAAVKN